MAVLRNRNLILTFLKANTQANHPVFDMLRYELRLSDLLKAQNLVDKDFTAVYFDSSNVDPITIGSAGGGGLYRADGSFKLSFGTPKQQLGGVDAYTRLLMISDFWQNKLRARHIESPQKESVIITSYTTLDEGAFDGFTKKAMLLTGTQTFTYYSNIEH